MSCFDRASTCSSDRTMTRMFDDLMSRELRALKSATREPPLHTCQPSIILHVTASYTYPAAPVMRIFEPMVLLLGEKRRSGEGIR